MKTNDTPHTARSVVVQTTLRVCEVDDDVLVISDRGCQTTTTTVPTVDNHSIVPFLEFTPFSEIVKDSQKVIDLPRKPQLQFDFNRRKPKKSVSELNPKSALKKSHSSTSKLSIDYLGQSPKMPQKTQEEQEIQTNLTVSPYILDEDGVANVCAQLSVQTSITFQPADSLSEVTPALKKSLQHTKNFQSVIIDGKIVTDYVDPKIEEESKKKENDEEEEDKLEETSSATESQDSVSGGSKKNSKEKPSISEMAAKPASKIEEPTSVKAFTSSPVPLYMTEEEFEKNVQRILDSTVKNVYQFMAKIIEMYENSKEKEESSVQLSPEMKTNEEPEKKKTFLSKFLPTFNEKDEENLEKEEDENPIENPTTKLESTTLDAPPRTGNNEYKLLQPEIPVGTSMERRRSSALRLVTGLVRGPKWVIQKALGVDVDTGLPMPEKRKRPTQEEVTMGVETNFEDSQPVIEYIPVDTKEASDQFSPKNKDPSKFERQKTLEETPEDTAESSKSLEQDGNEDNEKKNKSLSKDETLKERALVEELPPEEQVNENSENTEEGSKSIEQTKSQEIVKENENVLREDEDVKQIEELTNQENINSETFKPPLTSSEANTKDTTFENEKQDVTKIESEHSSTPEIDGLPKIEVNPYIIEHPGTPQPSLNIINEDPMIPTIAEELPSTTENIGDSPGKSANVIACECGAIHEGGAAPPALLAPRSQPETSIKFELTLVNDGKSAQNAIDGLIIKASISRVDNKKEQSDGGADIINVSVIVGGQNVIASSTGQLAIDKPPEEHREKEENGSYLSCLCYLDSQSSTSEQINKQNSGEQKEAELEVRMDNVNITTEEEAQLKSESSSKHSQAKEEGMEQQIKVEISPPSEIDPGTSVVEQSDEVPNESTEIKEPLESDEEVKVENPNDLQEAPDASLMEESNKVPKDSTEFKEPLESAQEDKVEYADDLQESQDTEQTEHSVKVPNESIELKEPLESAQEESPNDFQEETIVKLLKGSIECMCSENKEIPAASEKESQSKSEESIECLCLEDEETSANFQEEAIIKPESQEFIECSCQKDKEHKSQAKCSCEEENEQIPTSSELSETVVKQTTDSAMPSKVILQQSIVSKAKSESTKSQEVVICSCSKTPKRSEMEIQQIVSSAKPSKVMFPSSIESREKSEIMKEEPIYSYSKTLMQSDMEIEPTLSSVKSSKVLFPPSTALIVRSESMKSEEVVTYSYSKTLKRSEMEIKPAGSAKPSKVTLSPSTEIRAKSDSIRSEEVIICSCSKTPKQSEVKIKPTVSSAKPSRVIFPPSAESREKSQTMKSQEEVICSCSKTPKSEVEIKPPPGSAKPSKVTLSPSTELTAKSESMRSQGVIICSCSKTPKQSEMEIKQSVRSITPSKVTFPPSTISREKSQSMKSQEEVICSCSKASRQSGIEPSVGSVKPSTEMFPSSTGTKQNEVEIKPSTGSAKPISTHSKVMGTCECVEECTLKTFNGPVKECGPQNWANKSELQERSCKSLTASSKGDICICTEECQLKSISGPVKECGIQNELMKSESAARSNSKKLYSCSCKDFAVHGKQEICTCVEECQLITFTGPTKECGIQVELIKTKPSAQSESRKSIPCNCTEECQLKTLSGKVKECGTQVELIKRKSEPESQDIHSYNRQKPMSPSKQDVCTCKEECHLKTLTGPVKECGTQVDLINNKSEADSPVVHPCSCKKSMSRIQQNICTCMEECKLKLDGSVKECGTQVELIKTKSAVTSESRGSVRCTSIAASKQEICTGLETKSEAEIQEDKDSQEFLPCGCRKLKPTKPNISKRRSEMSKAKDQVCVCKESEKPTTPAQDTHVSGSKSLPFNVKQSQSKLCSCKIQNILSSRSAIMQVKSIIKSQISSLGKSESVSQKEITCIYQQSDVLEQLQGDTCPCKTKDPNLSKPEKSGQIKFCKTDDQLRPDPLNVRTLDNETTAPTSLKKDECLCSSQQNKKYKESIEDYMKKLLEDSINTKDPALIQQHAACLEPYLQQIANNLNEIEGIGGKEITCTGDASQQCSCSVEVLYVNGENQSYDKVDRSCACSIPRVKKPAQEKQSYREPISTKSCNCDMENDPTPNLACMYEGDDEYNETYMEELGDDGFFFRSGPTESEKLECSCREGELPEVLVDSDRCGSGIEMPWLSIALPPPGTFEITSKKPPKQICECWKLDLKDSVLSATEIVIEEKPGCGCDRKSQGFATVQPENTIIRSESEPAQLKTPSSSLEKEPCKDLKMEFSSDDESGCSCSTELDECGDGQFGSTKFVYDNPCFAQNEPYMDPLYKYFPDDCDTYCGPFTEIHWSDILLPKKVKLRQAPMPKSTNFEQEVLPVCDTVNTEIIEFIENENQNHDSERTSELEIEISFAQVASTLLKVEGGADSQHTVSEISTISDLRMKVKRCPKDYVVTIYAEGQYQNIKGMRTVGSQPFVVPNIEENISNFLVAIQPASYVERLQNTAQVTQPDLTLLDAINADSGEPKKSCSLPNMSVASLTSAEFREKFPHALTTYLKDKCNSSTKQEASTYHPGNKTEKDSSSPEYEKEMKDKPYVKPTRQIEEIEINTCYPCKKSVKDSPNQTEETKINKDHKKELKEKPKEFVNSKIVDENSLSVDTIKSEVFRKKYDIPPLKYEDPKAMGLYTYTMPEIDQRIIDISSMMAKNLELTVNDSLFGMNKIEEEIKVEQTKCRIPEVVEETRKPRRPCKPSCINTCSKGSTGSKLNIQEITRKEMESINEGIEEIKAKLRCMDIPELENWKKIDQPNNRPPCRRADPYTITQQTRFPPYEFAQPPQASSMYPSCYCSGQYTYSNAANYPMHGMTYPSYSTYMDSDDIEDYVCSCTRRRSVKRRKKRKIMASTSEYSCTSTGSSGSRTSASVKSIPSCRQKSGKAAKPTSKESNNRCSQVSFSYNNNSRTQSGMEIMEFSHYDHTPTDTEPEVEIRVGKGPPKIKTKDTFKGVITKEPNKCRFKVAVNLSPSKLRTLQRKKSLTETECSSCERIT